MSNVTTRKVELKYAVDKLGNRASESILEIPFEYDAGSFLDLILTYRTKHPKSYRSSQDSCLRFLICNLTEHEELSFFLSKASEMTLEQLCSHRASLYQLFIDKNLPLSYPTALCTLLTKTNAKLKCGRPVKAWPRFRSKQSASNKARQIQEKDTLWEVLKKLDSTENAKEKSQGEITLIHKSYLNAAVHDLKSYELILQKTEPFYNKYNSDFPSYYSRKIILNVCNRLSLSRSIAGSRFHHFHPLMRGTLPPRVLLAALVILKIEYPLNTDVYLDLTECNLTFNRTSVILDGAIKNKTSKELPAHTFTNRERDSWLAWKLLQTHFEKTKQIIVHYDIKMRREQHLFDWVSTRNGSRNNPLIRFNLNKDFQYLVNKSYSSFIEEHSLEKITLDGLRNLVATKHFLDDATVDEIKILLAHADRRTAEHYIEQHITSAFLRHNILCFMREFEKASIITVESSELFNVEVTTDTKGYYEIGDGSSCINPYDSPDSHQSKGDLCNGKYCHSQCKNNRIVLNRQSIYRALLKREYYRSHYFFMISNTEKFEAFEAEKVVFNALLCVFIQQERPTIYRHFMEIINNVESEKEDK